MQSALLLVLVAGANAFLKQDMQTAEQDTLTAWEKIQEDALARAGDELPKTVIRVAEAKPAASAFLEVEASADAAQEVTLKAPECMGCIKEHLYDAKDYWTLFDEDRAEQVCSFCALYAFGGIYAGKDAEVNPKAWGLLPKNKITLLEDNSLLASPARMKFWKDAANQVATGSFSLKDAIADAKELNDGTFNILQCAKSLNQEKCTVKTESFGASPMVLLEVQSKALIAQKYQKVQSGIAKMMGASNKMMEDAKKELEKAKLTGDAFEIAIAREALEMHQALTTDVLDEEENLKERMDNKVSAGALLQEQSIEQLAKTEKVEIQESVKKAIEQLKSSDGQEQGELLLTAAKTALSNEAQVELSPEQVTQIDNLLQDAVLNLQNVDTMGALAVTEAQKQVEESATQIFKAVMKNKPKDTQFKELVSRLSKFLPDEKAVKLNLLQKSRKEWAAEEQAKLNFTSGVARAPEKPKSPEQIQHEGLKALAGAFDHPIENVKKASFAGKSEAQEKYLQDVKKNTAAAKKETSLIQAIVTHEESKLSTEQIEQTQALHAIEQDLGALAGFDPQGEMFNDDAVEENDQIEA